MKEIKVKLVDRKGFSKIIKVVGKVLRIKYPLVTGGILSFELFDIPKKGLPTFKEVINLN